MDGDYKKEKSSGKISKDKLKTIIKQMERNICKIKNSKKEIGTGFFAKIPFPDELKLLPVLITNNHVLNEEDYNKDKFQISLDDEREYFLLLSDKSRKFYTNKKYDITIIEVKPDMDGIELNRFFDVEIQDENPIKCYKEKSIYLLQYPNGQLSFSDGVIKNIVDYFNIYYECDTESGSSGSPLILLDSCKVIGIHKANFKKDKSKIGTLLKLPIDDFNKKNNLNKIFEEIQEKKLEILTGINNKKELLYLFFYLNNKIFQKKYFGEIILNFININEPLIKVFFGNDVGCTKKINNFNKLNEIKQEEEKRNLLEIIKIDINNNRYKLYNIIASFYYILFYKLKDINAINHLREMSNIGNVLINVIFENFVYFLSLNFKNLDKNLLDSVQNLYLYDIKNLINLKYFKDKTQAYNFIEIKSLLSSNEKVKKDYELTKKDYEPYNDNIFTYVGKFLNSKFREVIISDFEKYIKLVPIEQKICSNSITIIIDEYILEDININERYRDIMNIFQDKTIFYFFGWPSLSRENYEKMNNDIYNNKKKAKICGKILSYILLSSNFFSNFKINLVGLGLGNLVIKCCIKELYKIYHKYGELCNNEEENSEFCISNFFYNICNSNFIYNIFNGKRKVKNNCNFEKNKNYVNLNDVILILAGSYIKNSWKKYTEETVVNKVLYCSSQTDEKLRNLNNILF